MRNLKKYLAVLLTVAMLITSMAPVFADTAATLSADVQAAKDLGMLVGDSDAGVTAAYVATTPSRAQAAVLFLRLKGLEATAKAFKGTDNFSDVSATNWFAPYAAYLKANPALGFEGVGNNEFAPEAKITAQQYYKVVLTALGYVQGKDFEYSDVTTFAASKGLSKVASVSNFTVADVATATVEGLKAAVKGSTDTLATKLIAAGAISVEKAVYANVYVKPTVVVTKGIESVTNKAASISVKLTYTPADASKVAIVAKRGNIEVTKTFTQDTADKTLFVYTAAANLVADDYTVTVKDDTTDLGSKVITIKDEKVAAIEFTSKQIIRYTDFDGYAYYKVTNQYGEDVTKKSIASNLTWNASIGSGNLTETKDGYIKINYGTSSSDYLKKLKDYTTTPITIYVYDRDSGATATANLTVSIAAGDIQNIKLNGYATKDGKKEIYRNNTADEFYIDYTITDSNGMAITSYDILSNTNVLTVYPGTSDSSAIARVEVKQDPNDSKKALFLIRTKENVNLDNQYDGVGTQSVNFIASGTGKTGAIDVKVLDKTDAVETFVLQKPATDVTEDIGWVEIPYVATDKSGNTVTSYDALAGKIDFGTTDKSKYNEVRMPDGSYKFFWNFGKSEYVKDYMANLTATVRRTYKNSNITITIKEVSVPYSLASIPFDQYMVGDAFTTKHAGDIVVNDKYGNRINIKDYETTSQETDKLFNPNNTTKAQYDYFVVGKSLDTTRFKVYGAAIGADSTLDYKLRVQGVWVDPTDANPGANYGSADVKFFLLKKAHGTALPRTGTDLNGDGNEDVNVAAILLDAESSTGTTYKIVDTKTITFYNVDPKNIGANYAIDAISTPLYADPLQSSTVKSLDGTNQAVAVKGIIGGSTKVILPLIDLNGTDATTKKVGIIKSSFGVSDATQFALAQAKNAATDTTYNGSVIRNDYKGGNTTQVYVYALPVLNNQTTATSSVVASVRGYNKVVYSVSTPITSSNAYPTAQSGAISVNGSRRDNVAGFNTHGIAETVAGVGTTGFATTFTAQGVSKVAEGYYEIKAADFGTWFGSTYSMNATGKAGIRFRFTNQYGKSDKLNLWNGPTSISLVDNCGGKYILGGSDGMSLICNSGTPGVDALGNAVNEQVIISATRDGKVINATLTIKGN